MSKAKNIACIGRDCVACGRCVKECPFGAISVYKGLYAVVDQNKCIGCGKCMRVCPAGVIGLIAKRGETA